MQKFQLHKLLRNLETFKLIFHLIFNSDQKINLRSLQFLWYRKISTWVTFSHIQQFKLSIFSIKFHTQKFQGKILTKKILIPTYLQSCLQTKDQFSTTLCSASTSPKVSLCNEFSCIECVSEDALDACAQPLPVSTNNSKRDDSIKLCKRKKRKNK